MLSPVYLLAINPVWSSLIKEGRTLYKRDGVRSEERRWARRKGMGVEKKGNAGAGRGGGATHTHTHIKTKSDLPMFNYFVSLWWYTVFRGFPLK